MHGLFFKIKRFEVSYPQGACFVIVFCDGEASYATFGLIASRLEPEVSEDRLEPKPLVRSVQEARMSPSTAGLSADECPRRNLRGVSVVRDVGCGTRLPFAASVLWDEQLDTRINLAAFAGM